MPIIDLLNPNEYTDKLTVRSRRVQCNSCPERLAKYGGQDLKKTDQCPVCHCFIKLKTLLKTESCPQGDW